MYFVVTFVFHQPRQILNRRLMIAEAMIQRADHEVVEWWRVGYRLQQTFALFDDFGDFETVPASFLFAQDGVGGDVEIEDSFDLARLRVPRHDPDHQDDTKKEDHYDRRKPHYTQHRHYHNHRDRLRREFPRTRHNASTSIAP